MSLLSFNGLYKHIIEGGVLTTRDGLPIDPAQINAASVDIRLGRKVMVECAPTPDHRIIDYRARTKMTMREVIMDQETGYVLRPGEFILSESEEIFHLPNHLSCEYKLKSSMARIGLEHLNAGWADAGWHGSVLTLEFKNVSQHHSIRIRPGDMIGQMVIFEHEPVPADRSYAARGRYNNDTSVSAIKK